jgi:MFS family permease
VTESAHGLWRNSDFLKLWGGETVSQFGNQISQLALPLTAVLALDASPAEMGVLNAAIYAPFLVLTLLVGVWVDRAKRRPIMLLSAVGRALVLAILPALHVLDVLSIGHLYVAALVLGSLTVFFEVTYQSYLPSLVRSDQLVESNSKLQVSASSAQVGGPALAGWLVGWLGGPVALLIDAVSFVVSALSLAAIRTKEERPEPPAREGRSIIRDIGKGLRFTFGNRWLRPCVLEAGTYNMFWLTLETVFLLYTTDELGLGPGAIGLVLGGGAMGALVGSFLPGWLGTRWGIGPTISMSMVLGCAAPVLVPLAAGPTPVLLSLLVVSFFLGGAGTTVANVHVVSLRQVVTPPDVLGRMNASYRFVAWGTVPIGALLGGALGSTIGLRPTLFVAAAGVFSAALWIVLSPVRSLRVLPETPATEPDTLPTTAR